jgi:hypothetical protein
MQRIASTVFAFLLTSAFLAGCGGSQSAPGAPTGAAEEPKSAPEPAPSEGEDASERPAVTAPECEAGGGVVVGDIGDGAIHRPEYRCPSGAPPSGSIRAAEGGPMGVEGSVCCPK